MAEIMWCESCRMRINIDVDCNIKSHVHRPLQSGQTRNDSWSKQRNDIVIRLREEALRPAMRGVCNDAADEIILLRNALDFAVSELLNHGEYKAWTFEMLVDQFLQEAEDA